MDIEVDKPCWSVISDADTDGCTAIDKPSCLCVFAADVDEPVLCLYAIYSLGSKTTSSLGCCASATVYWMLEVLVVRPVVEVDVCRPVEACEGQLRGDESLLCGNQVKCPTWDAVLVSDLPCCTELCTGGMSAARYASILALY